MKKICYTSIFGDYDDLKEPSTISDGWEYILFSDRQHKSSVWKTIIINEGLGNRIQSRKCLIKPFNYIEYDICVSVGGQTSINCDLNVFVEENDSEFSIMKHPIRNCTYEESEVCINHNLGNKEQIIKQIETYKNEGFPKNEGMVETGVMIRKNTKNNFKHCTFWFDEVIKYSTDKPRDQLSFNYVLWKYKLITPNFIDWNTLNNKFIIHPHKTPELPKDLKLNDLFK